MGGSESIDYLAPAGSGENTLVTCERGDYAADLEVARGVPRPPQLPRAPRRSAGDRDAGRHDDRGARRAARARPGGDLARRCPSSRPTARSCSRWSAGTTASTRPSSRRRSASGFRPPTEDDIRAAFGADPGSLGPVGFAGEIVADEALRGRPVRRGCEPHRVGTSAASRPAATPTRGSPTSGRRRRATRCPVAGAALRFQVAIEVGHIFKLGTRYSDPARRAFLDEDGARGRSSWAPTASGRGGSWRQRSSSATTSSGSRGPPPLAPYDVHIVAIGAAGPEAVERAERLAAELEAAGISTSCSTTATAGRARSSPTPICIGCPVRVTVGKKTLEDGHVDLLVRAGRAEERVPETQAVTRIATLL